MEILFDKFLITILRKIYQRGSNVQFLTQLLFEISFTRFGLDWFAPHSAKATSTAASNGKMKPRLGRIIIGMQENGLSRITLEGTKTAST